MSIALTPDTKPSKTPRVKAFVDNEVQGGILQKIAFHWLMLFVCNTLALAIWLRVFESPDATWSETFRECWMRFLPFFVVTSALIPAFVWDTIKLTNRFAGPISRLKQSLVDARSGRQVKPLQFRSNDFWSALADDFNEVVIGPNEGEEKAESMTHTKVEGQNES